MSRHFYIAGFIFLVITLLLCMIIPRAQRNFVAKKVYYCQQFVDMKQIIPEECIEYVIDKNIIKQKEQ